MEVFKVLDLSQSMVVCEEHTYSRFKYGGGENTDLAPTGLSFISSTSPRVDYNCLSVEDPLYAKAHFGNLLSFSRCFI
jgi:hypothetical protein